VDGRELPDPPPASEADERCPSDGVEPIGEVVEIGVEQMPVYVSVNAADA
jgi:hypothetical protein